MDKIGDYKGPEMIRNSKLSAIFPGIKEKNITIAITINKNTHSASGLVWFFDGASNLISSSNLVITFTQSKQFTKVSSQNMEPIVGVNCYGGTTYSEQIRCIFTLQSRDMVLGYMKFTQNPENRYTFHDESVYQKIEGYPDYDQEIIFNPDLDLD